MDKISEKDRAFLSLKHLVKIYPNGEKAVYDFDLDIEKNEFIVIVGPSGCGKSTTLRMVAGLEDISSGEIYMENELLNYKPCKDRKMAIVFQSYALYPQMNVYENIAFPLTINKYNFPKRDEILFGCSEAQNMIETVDMKDLLDSLFGCFHNKQFKSDCIFNISAILSVSISAAQQIYELFLPYKRKNIHELHGDRGRIKEEWLRLLSRKIEQEKQNNIQKNIVLDDEYFVLDREGNRETEFRKMTPHEIKAKVYQTAETLDLAAYLDKLPKELSGGQMQRVALGRAIVKNVPIFLMDEPLSNLDAKLRVTMRSEIVKLHNKINATTIYVTHDQTEAMTMATRIVVMSKGFVQQIGSPEEIYKFPSNIFVARFIGSPAMNFFELTFDRDKMILENNDLQIPVSEAFVKGHDQFYHQKMAELENYKNNFDEKAKEYVLKILSVTGEKMEIAGPKKRTGFSLFKKAAKDSVADVVSEEEKILQDKLAGMKKAAVSSHQLLVGIRPENIQIEKYNDTTEPGEAIVLNPTVCELLGGEYHVHFDFCGKDMVGKIDAKNKITPKDKIAVRFSLKDIILFDPITGDTING